MRGTFVAALMALVAQKGIGWRGKSIRSSRRETIKNKVEFFRKRDLRK